MIKTGRRDAAKRVVYLSPSGAERVRRKVAATGKMAWAAPAKAAKPGAKPGKAKPGKAKPGKAKKVGGNDGFEDRRLALIDLCERIIKKVEKDKDQSINFFCCLDHPRDCGNEAAKRLRSQTTNVFGPPPEPEPIYAIDFIKKIMKEYQELAKLSNGKMDINGIRLFNVHTKTTTPSFTPESKISHFNGGDASQLLTAIKYLTDFDNPNVPAVRERLKREFETFGKDDGIAK